ncbi:hypothetical protein OMW55_11045 [Sphingomonas sp. BN140010]|uniref:GP-PDE domain-containing protein n=1 Tax=Sphingomonas arvum TaxID=2992113 RepID=A0ABT3JGX2_9SPHN|nr:hypothetical protein [Sphingomonas sp. BN140010]MCW3798339.1 hypothetical protein [Sphingomonas sp. BN140010]
MRDRRFLGGALLVVLLPLLSLVLAAMCLDRWGYPTPPERCANYRPAPGPLIAHAGGGLPDRIYSNELAAMKLARAHGFRWIELDFVEEGGAIRLGHDPWRMSGTTVAQLLAWLQSEPSVRIVTDFKTPNVSGLAALRRAAGPLQDRFIPQIYSPSEYHPVRRLGYGAPILTAYRLGWLGWQRAANRLPLLAVTLPYNRRFLAPLLRHPIFLHTVNEPVPGVGLYTDCLVPLSRSESG